MTNLYPRSFASDNPPRSVTFVKPAFLRLSAAAALRLPLRQYTANGMSFATSGYLPDAISLDGSSIEPAMWPAAYSSLGLRSVSFIFVGN